MAEALLLGEKAFDEMVRFVMEAMGPTEKILATPF